MTLADWPLRPGQNWREYVTQVETEAEWKALRRSARVGTPFGKAVWQQATAKRLGLESTVRTPGRLFALWKKGQLPRQVISGGLWGIKFVRQGNCKSPWFICCRASRWVMS